MWSSQEASYHNEYHTETLICICCTCINWLYDPMGNLSPIPFCSNDITSFPGHAIPISICAFGLYT